MQLDALQSAMMKAIEQGPDSIEPEAFIGSRARIVRGFAVHANTISHARLVALEETFPRTRQALGDERFNALCRSYCNEAGFAAETLITSGRRFPDFLAGRGATNTETDIASLAVFEWQWLESYHAAEAPVLALADLAGLSQEALLATRLARHPATRLCAEIADPTLMAEFPDLGGAAAILISRPDADVRITPASLAMARQYDLLSAIQPVCNLLAPANEQDEEDSLQAMLAMLNAGSLVLAD